MSCLRKCNCLSLVRREPAIFNHKIWCLCFADRWSYHVKIYAEKSCHYSLGSLIVSKMVDVVSELPTLFYHSFSYYNFYSSYNLLKGLFTKECNDCWYYQRELNLSCTKELKQTSVVKYMDVVCFINNLMEQYTSENETKTEL